MITWLDGHFLRGRIRRRTAVLDTALPLRFDCKPAISPPPDKMPSEDGTKIEKTTFSSRSQKNKFPLKDCVSKFCI